LGKPAYAVIFYSVFVHGNPVGYSENEEIDKLALNPAENPTREINPPVWSAMKSSGKWLPEKQQDRNWIDQVLKNVTRELCLFR
jgi:hypothetical protein